MAKLPFILDSIIDVDKFAKTAIGKKRMKRKG